MRRKSLVLISFTALGACSGGGPESAGGNAVGGGVGTGAGTGTGTVSSNHTFVTPTEVKTYQSQGAAQSFSYRYNELVHFDKRQVFNADGTPVLDSRGNPTYEVDPATRRIQPTATRPNADYQDQQLYNAGSSTVRSPGVTVTYDPRNAVFSLAISQNGVDENITFQDPAHRTDFGGARQPQPGVPNLDANPIVDSKGVRYLQVDSGSTDTVYDVSSFFYELPGTTTKYVTYAGFVRNHFEDPTEAALEDRTTDQDAQDSRKTKLERAAFVFGEQTSLDDVPKSGTASFSGNMIASMVNNPTLDTTEDGTYFQWIKGTANVAVNFGTNSFTTTMAGTTFAALTDPRSILPVTNQSTYAFDQPTIAAGATFAATGSGQIDLVGKGGLVGTYSEAHFVSNGTTLPVTIAGSTVDGAFYGPHAAEVGGTFRIVGGVPDERVDIIGSFTGAK